MTSAPTCPRCDGRLHRPDLMSSDWRCDLHGVVAPFHVLPRATAETVEFVARRAAVPLWMPMPAPPGWTVTGLGYAGDERTGALGSALACSGPAPLGGAADMVLVAEELGVGLGARFAGLEELDPGQTLAASPASVKVPVSDHLTPLWSLPEAADRAVFVGEAMGVWIWVVLWPPDAGYVFAEHVELQDLREHSPDGLVFGAASPYLRATGG